MPDDKNKDKKGGNGGDKDTPLTLEQVKELQTEVATLREKHTNLNQGIAKYRDDAQDKDRQVKELTKQVKVLDEKIKAAAAAEGIDTKDAEKLEAWAKKKGFITKAELEALKTTQSVETQKGIQFQAVSEFLEKHPEYNTDENWQKIQAEFNLYKVPATLQGYKKLLERIHNKLSGGDKKGAKIRAKLTKKGRLSLGGGSQKVGDREAEIENLQKKYPNLSREQIEDQLGKIDALYPEKKED